MKKTLRILILVAVLLLGITLVACGSVESIYFEKTPRTTYVQGQDLDFEDTVLVAMKNSKSETVDMNSDNVVIEGYDKNTLGKQTVTFTYKEASTTLDVTVIPRIAVEGAVESYFVGDSFDKTKGRIRVANDKGNTSSINISDSSVTVTGFDSSAATTAQTLTISYGSYTGTFSVNIYDVDKVELSTKPKKISYESHETDFDVTGAYFTVTAKDGALERFVELTTEMVVGFDPEAATFENSETPLPQTVKLSYLGYQFDFKISIRYSAVSLMQDRAAALASVTDPKKATAEQGELALGAIREYLNLSDANKKLVTEDEKNTVVTIAAVYGMSKLNEEVKTYSDTFNLAIEDGDAVINIPAKSYASMVADLKRLNSDDDPFVAVSVLLADIKEEFADMEILDSEPLDDYLAIACSEDTIQMLRDVFTFMTGIYDTLKHVPDNWTVEDLEAYKDDVKNAVVTISGVDDAYKPYTYTNYFPIYRLISAWRTNDDLYDIIYAYYIEYENDSIVDAIWQKVPLPGDLQTLYLMIRNGISQTSVMKVGTDTTAFMYYYREAKLLAEKIKVSGNEVRNKIYSIFNFDRLIEMYFYTGDYDSGNGIAYVYHVASLVGNEKYETFLDKYLALVDVLAYDEELDYTSSEVQEDAKELLELYVSFTPAEQYAFLCALHCDYRYTNFDQPVLSSELNDKGEMVIYNWFTIAVIKSYKEILSEEAFDILQRLLVASEYYATRYSNKNAYDNFMSEMETIISDASKLSTADIAEFKFALDKYTMLYNECKNPTDLDISEYQAQFDELYSVIDFFLEVNLHINNGEITESERMGLYSLLFAASEKAKTLADDLLATKNSDVIYTFLYTLYEFNTTAEADGEDILCTYDYILDEIIALRYRILVSASVIIPGEGDEKDREHRAFVIYNYEGIRSFLVEAYEIMYAEYKGEAANLDAEKVLSIMAKYRELDDNSKYAFKMLNMEVFYFDAILHCFEGKLTAEVYEMLEMLVKIEDAYAMYFVNDTDNNLTAFKNAVAAYTALYDSFEDKDALADFDDVYNYYLEKSNTISDSDNENGDNVTPTPTPDPTPVPTPGETTDPTPTPTPEPTE